ncbi:hypothetical protein [Brucella pituitosa]|uniref:Uncharacterized protein n=1 Tax=Brucella pituitosa TaxID=571256 RepID=A0ABS3K0H8_9HYPH|nr:hypothetical protein [Brucella pituitosa]MBO1040424.1 hypothetical protein [Brucella pituitosa]PRA46662.1 hypothetical protein CQ062_23265 [Ochrobactrum sp. MYb68]
MKPNMKDKYFSANDNNTIDEDQYSSSPYARDLDLRGWQTAAIKRREEFEFYAVDGIYLADLLEEAA